MKKNDVFEISSEPRIVGVVKRLKCARDNRWVISATDGHEYIYNANSGSWSRGAGSFAEFEPLTNEKLISEDLFESSEPNTLDLVSGQMWEDATQERVLILDMSLNGEYPGYTSDVDSEHFYIVGIHVDRSISSGVMELYNEQGIAYGLLVGNHNLISKLEEVVDYSLV